MIKSINFKHKLIIIIGFTALFTIYILNSNIDKSNDIKNNLNNLHKQEMNLNKLNQTIINDIINLNDELYIIKNVSTRDILKFNEDLKKIYSKLNILKMNNIAKEIAKEQQIDLSQIFNLYKSKIEKYIKIEKISKNTKVNSYKEVSSISIKIINILSSMNNYSEKEFNKKLIKINKDIKLLEKNLLISITIGLTILILLTSIFLNNLFKSINILKASINNLIEAIDQRDIDDTNIYIKENNEITEVAKELNKRTPFIRDLIEQLHHSVFRDGLTNLHNRRFLEEEIHKVISKSQRDKENLAILMIDMDHFKQVNDIHGHDAGDLVLKELALTLINNVRDSDYVIRYGGEEFIILLQNVKSKEDANGRAEIIRSEVEKKDFILANHTILKKTISIGIALFPNKDSTLEDVMKEADTALYFSKENGRNQINLANQKE